MASMFQGVARDIEHFVRDIPIQYRIIRATVKISEDQFSREGLKMTSDMHETL